MTVAAIDANTAPQYRSFKSILLRVLKETSPVNAWLVHRQTGIARAYIKSLLDLHYAGKVAAYCPGIAGYNNAEKIRGLTLGLVWIGEKPEGFDTVIDYIEAVGARFDNKTVFLFDRPFWIPEEFDLVGTYGHRAAITNVKI